MPSIAAWKRKVGSHVVIYDVGARGGVKAKGWGSRLAASHTRMEAQGRGFCSTEMVNGCRCKRPGVGQFAWSRLAQLLTSGVEVQGRNAWLGCTAAYHVLDKGLPRKARHAQVSHTC